MSIDRLIEKINTLGNPTVAGLDPKLSFIPGELCAAAFAKHGLTLEGAAEVLLSFNKGLIDALCEIVPAVKLQAAYYELYGWPGVRALADSIAYAKEKGLYVITDGKRNDIGSTVEVYAAAHLGSVVLANGTDRVELEPFGADALTVNGYLGTDGVKPLLDVCKSHNKAIFVLCKTSNQSSGELQDLTLANGETIYSRMALMCDVWGAEVPGAHGYTGVGAVVGATYPEQLGELRAAHPSLFMLVPGYGAQGGGAADVAGAFDRNGGGAVINSSRAIMCAWQKNGGDYQEAARAEAIRMRDELRSVIGH